MSSAKSSSSPKRQTGSSTVIYQKIVRPPSGMVAALLLGYLVEYLQEQFILPDRLPMTYSISTPTNPSSREPIVQWNSPLSPNPTLTAISVHIIGIYGDVSDDKRNVGVESSWDTAPNMAMVVVEKSSSSSRPEPPIPPMLANLFSDSERQIVRALDRGLDEFMLGMVPSQQKPRDPKTPLSAMPYDSHLTMQENAISAAKMLHDTFESNAAPPPMDDDLMKNHILPHQNGFIDANITQRNGVNVVADTERPLAPRIDNDVAASAQQRKQREAALRSMMYNSTSQHPLSTTATARSPSEGLDVAVQAARLAHAKRQRKNDEIIDSTDYAVETALRVAAQRRLDTSQSSTTVKSEKSSKTVSRTIPKHVVTTKANVQGGAFSDLRSPMLDSKFGSSNNPNGRRAFMSTISTPKSFLEGKMEAKNISQPQGVQGKADALIGDIVVNATLPLDSSTVSQIVVGESAYEKTPQTNRSINLKIHKNATEADAGIPHAEKDASLQITEEKEVMKATLDALNELADSGRDLTAEELLNEVMRYGEDQDRQQQVGAGFVSGAFEKAKALLREQTKRRQERMQLDPLPSTSSAFFNEREPLNPSSDSVAVLESLASETISPSEELRRMFEAGERLAEGRITTVNNDIGSSSVQRRSPTDQDIDEIVDSDKTVSRHARVLDDELTELMVRINRSPGEETDGPNRNPLFDIFSGPEVYDQNVDPLTAVNWPGALPGSKPVLLPKDLDEAVRQAKFAAQVLVNMREVESSDGSLSYSVGTRELSAQQVANLNVVVQEAVEIGLIDDPYLLQEEESRLGIVVNELIHQPDERMREIASNYKDLLLSDNFVGLIRKRLNDMANRELDALRHDDDSLKLIHAREREVLGQLVAFAQLLLKEVQALGAELESQQLEVIRSICRVAMDPSHRTEEEASMALTDAVRDMRPLFDDGFIAYLKYAVAEEEGRLARAGLLNDPEHTQWLYVLKIVQQGVHAEIAKGINRYLEHIWYVLRMETPVERRMLLEKLVDIMPTLDVRPFVQVVDNIVGSLGDSVRGEFDGATTLGEMTNKLLQLRRDLKEILPPERLAEKSRDADEWVAKQKQRLLEQRNLTKQRLKAAQDTEYLDSTIESFGKSGEVERFE